MAHQRHEQRAPERREPERREPRALRPVHPVEEQWTPAGPFPVGVPGERVNDLRLNAQATVGDPVPLGLAAFAAATFTFGAVCAGWVGGFLPGLITAVPVMLIFGGIAQFITAMWAYRKGQTFAATAFGAFGALYAVLSLIAYMSANGTLPLGSVPGNATVGITLAMFALIAAYLAFAALGLNTVLVGAYGSLAVSLALLCAGFFAGVANPAIMVGGYVALVSGLIAFYASAATVVNSIMEREVLPY